MSVKIRLSRRGSKGNPFYDIVSIDSRSARDAKFIEKLGFFDPMVTEETEDRKRLKIDQERVKYWISVGAQPSETVAKLLVKSGMSEAQKFVPNHNAQFIGLSRDAKKKTIAEAADAEKKRIDAAKKAKAEQASASESVSANS